MLIIALALITVLGVLIAANAALDEPAIQAGVAAFALRIALAVCAPTPGRAPIRTVLIGATS